jgi:hypothetical protein
MFGFGFGINHLSTVTTVFFFGKLCSLFQCTPSVICVADLDPVLFSPGSRNEKNMIREPGSRINILDHISKSIVTKTCVKNIKILRCGFGIRCLFDSGSGMGKLGSG